MPPVVLLVLPVIQDLLRIRQDQPDPNVSGPTGPTGHTPNSTGYTGPPGIVGSTGQSAIYTDSSPLSPRILINGTQVSNIISSVFSTCSGNLGRYFNVMFSIPDNSGYTGTLVVEIPPGPTCTEEFIVPINVQFTRTPFSMITGEYNALTNTIKLYKPNLTTGITEEMTGGDLASNEGGFNHLYIWLYLQSMRL